MSGRRYTFVCTFLSGLFLAHAALAGINFTGAELLSVAPQPEFMMVGDLNNDGKTDVVVVSPASKEADVYVATTATTSFFAPAQTIHFGNTLRNGALGDLNKDGRLDLVVTDQAADGVWILIGAGDGTFLTPYLVDVPGSRSVHSVGIGNFDNIGNDDLVISDTRVARVFILNNDNGSPPRFLRGGEVEVGMQPEDVLVGDFNKDGHPDFITLNQGGPAVKDVSVVLWKRAVQGFAEFELPQKYTAGEKPSNIILADLNSDGAPDVVMLNKPRNGVNSEVDVFMNQGNGVLFPPLATQVPCPFFTGGAPCKALTLAAGDWDGNGDEDIMVGLADPRRNRGDASQLADAMQAFGGRGDGVIFPGGVFATQKLPVSMGVGDVNGDGTLDLVIANRRTLDLQAFINTSTAGGTMNGDSCLLGEECLSSRCLNGVCCASQCAVGEQCDVPGREGICVPIPVTPIACSEPDNPCEKRCVSSDNAGALCTRDGDCPGGSCVGAPCVTGFCCDQPCDGGRCNVDGFIGVCIPGLDPGVDCTENDQCKTGFCSTNNQVCCNEQCDDGFCGPADSVDPQPGVCGPLKPNGSPCDSGLDQECESGVCDEFDLICCNRRCDSATEKCFEGDCVPIDFTPSPTPTKTATFTPTLAPTHRLTPGLPGQNCTFDDECTTPFCRDGVCCKTDSCPENMYCSPGDGNPPSGECVVGPPTPTPTATRLPTLPTPNPCGSCPSGTHCDNGNPPLCVKTSSSGGCSTVGDPAAGNLAVVTLLPLALWLTRRWQLRRVRVRSRAPRS